MAATGDPDENLYESSSATNSSQPDISNAARNIFGNLGIGNRNNHRSSRASTSSQRPSVDGGAARSLAIARVMQERAADRQAMRGTADNAVNTRECVVVCRASG